MKLIIRELIEMCLAAGRGPVSVGRRCFTTAELKGNKRTWVQLLFHSANYV